MNNKLRDICKQALINLGPYFLLGIFITCVIGLFILSYYVLLGGLLFGFVLWVAAFVKRQLFSKKESMQKTRGRIIDHDKNQ